jgi:hypothetical protein
LASNSTDHLDLGGLPGGGFGVVGSAKRSTGCTLSNSDSSARNFTERFFCPAQADERKCAQELERQQY